jgi:hypothetical protein
MVLIVPPAVPPSIYPAAAFVITWLLRDGVSINFFAPYPKRMIDIEILTER